ncbi:MAG: hypothetical protein WC554_16575 [Clostridia bacterium]|jgi:hypothetical protein
MKKTLCTIKIHSTIDLITNSSTELFCTVKAKDEDTIREVIDEILKECECEILRENGLDIDQHYEYDKDYNEIKVEGQFDIIYEQHAPPCGLILRRIKETLK